LSKQKSTPVKSLLADQVIGALRKVLPDTTKTYPLHEPTFHGNEWKYVKECLDSTFVSSVGKFVDRFEVDFASYTWGEWRKRGKWSAPFSIWLPSTQVM